MRTLSTLQARGMKPGVLKFVNRLNRRRVRSSICSTKAAIEGGETAGLV